MYTLYMYMYSVHVHCTCTCRLFLGGWKYFMNAFKAIIYVH